MTPRVHSTITRVIQELIDIKFLPNTSHLEMSNGSSDPVDTVLVVLCALARVINRLEKIQNLIVADLMRNLADHQLPQ